MPIMASKYSPFNWKTIEKISLTLLLTFIFSGQGSTFFIEKAHAVKAGQSCAKAGLKNSSFVCTKVKSKLIWQLVKKKQSISASYPTNVNVATQTQKIDYFSTSKLPVSPVALTPEICKLNDKILQLYSIGFCMVRFTQLGNSQYLAALPVEIKVLIYGNNEIVFNPPTSLPLVSNNYSLLGTSTSGLPVAFESLTPDICSLSQNTLELIKVGYCKVVAVQSGSEFYDPALSVEVTIVIQGGNQISFTPINSLLLSTKTYALSGTSTSGLPLKYNTQDAEICSVSESILTLLKVGVCRVLAVQGGSDLYPAAQSVEATIVISGARVMSDQPDTVNGFQVKAIYVVPSDGVDNSYDTNGYIAGFLDEGNKYLQAQLGLQVPIDKNTVSYDIQFLKTKLTTSYLLSASSLIDDLMAESMVLENPGINRKDFIFFIDVNDLKNGTACGYAGLPGISAVVAIGRGVVNGSKCTGKALNFNDYAAVTWPHELIHNFGVSHTLDNPCDFMRGNPETPGTCPSNGVLTIDKERSRYVGSSAQGQDILKLPVWEGYTNKDYWSRCFLNPVPRADGFKYAYCPTGTQTIGALTYCWGSFSSVVLEEFVDGSWRSLGAGNHYSDPWGPSVSWKCSAGFSAPWKEVMVTTPKIALYRWMRNGVESEQFKVIWVK
ncbi:MAG: hypothetical protein Q7R42_02105 [Candidatus Planktophila sp.]|nr:hypothetical protein [Candidatus Planktophila sp.]